MTNYEPFRNAKVGDKVRAPQIFSGELEIMQIDNYINYPVLVGSPQHSIKYAFTFEGKKYVGAEQRALWYTNDKGELLPDRPKKMVEKVMAQGYTRFCERGMSCVPYTPFFTVPYGTPYRIIVEVEE